ncbi:fungal hydrophobin-domain-containing protein [Xylaria arbuscula]|nr:fungal hydrophobin-domain-containing protein [Xylaria arbuscula]
MQFTLLIAAVFATAVAASPLDLPSPPEKRSTYSTTPLPTSTPTPSPGGGGGAYDACPSGLYSNPQCCATDVLGVADLDCGSVPAIPTSASEFQSICAAGAQRARCCVIPVLGQAVLCTTPVGL